MQNGKGHGNKKNFVITNNILHVFPFLPFKNHKNKRRKSIFIYNS